MQWRSISCQYLRSLMMRFEAGPKEGPRCPDGGALLAYQCAAGKWTIAFGVRWHPDGRPVVEGDTITPEQVWEYTDAAVARVEADIRSVVTVEMNPHQYAGIVFWVYNLGIGALVNTMEGESQLLPKINAGRWLDAAAAMGVFVYATTEKGGKTWKRAMFGLFIRRSAEGLTLMGFDWPYACEPERLSLPTRTDWQPARDRYYDAVLEGKTPFLNVLRDAKDYPLTLVLTQPAPPLATSGSKEAVGAGPLSSPSPSVVPHPPSVSPAPTPPSPAEKPAMPSAPSVASRAPSTPGGVIVTGPKPPSIGDGPAGSAKPPPPPVILPPSVQVNTQSDMGPTTRTMWVSKRFWGGVLIIAGRLIIVADVGGHFSPAVKSFIGDGVLMDWMTGVIVTMIGEMVLDRGEKKATGPMDTPKRIALTTPAP